MIQYILYLILIFAPIARGAVRIWAYGPIYILTLLMLIFWVFNIAKEKEIRIKRTPIDMPILLFAIISLISIINSKYIYGSIMEIVKFVILALIFYIVVNFIKGERKIKRMLNIILAIGTGVALFGILQYLGVIDKSWWDNAMFLSATYVNHNHFAGLMELVIPLSLGMVLSEKDIGKRSLYIYAFLIMASAFLLSMSRGGWFSLSVALLFMTFFILRKGKARFIFFMSILLLITIGIFVFNATETNLLSSRLSSYGELDFGGRLEIWKGTAGIIKNNWFLGTGPGTFIYNFPKYRPIGLTRLINYAHSDYLQIFSELGIFTLGLMIYIIFTIIKKSIQTHSVATLSFKRWISISLATGILSLAIHSIGDFNLYIPANAILFCVFSAFIFNITSRREKEARPLVINYGVVFKPIISVAIAMLIILMVSSLFAEVCITEAEKLLLNNKSEKAELMALFASRLSPLNHKYHYKLAEIRYKKVDIKESVDGYKKALFLNPMDAWSWIGLADSYYGFYKNSRQDEKSFTLADLAYRNAIDLDPSNSYYLKEYAGFLLDTGNTALSSKMYKKASYIMSKSDSISWLPTTFAEGEAYKEKADMAFYAQDFQRALVLYDMAEHLIDRKEELKLGKFRCYTRMSLLKEAFNKYRELKSSRKNKSIFFSSLGEYYLKKGFIETARRLSEKSIILDPNNPEAYQLKFKIIKRYDIGCLPLEEVRKLVDFNNAPLLSLDLDSHRLEMVLDVNERLRKEGYLNLDVVLPAGIYEFSIRAKGKRALGIWPHMIIRFNDKNFIESYVNNEDWGGYPGIIVADYPLNRFEILFDNDYYDEETKEDRNLYVDSIKLRMLN